MIYKKEHIKSGMYTHSIMHISKKQTKNVYTSSNRRNTLAQNSIRYGRIEIHSSIKETN
jgi:hypothetical protein